MVEIYFLMSISLLKVVGWPAPKRPIMIDNVPVPKECAPFLVTSTRSLLWVAGHNGGVRLAVRQCAPGDLFREVVEQVALRSLEDGWGSVLPVGGLEEGLGYLESFGVPNPCFLHSPAWSGPTLKGGTEASWLPNGWGVLIPQDRDYLGVAYDFGDGYVAGVVHNAARGMVVLQP